MNTDTSKEQQNRVRQQRMVQNGPNGYCSIFQTLFLKIWLDYNRETPQLRLKLSEHPPSPFIMKFQWGGGTQGAWPSVQSCHANCLLLTISVFIPIGEKYCMSCGKQLKNFDLVMVESVVESQSTYANSTRFSSPGTIRGSVPLPLSM